MTTRRRMFNLVTGETRFGSVKAEAAPGQIYLYDEISYFGVMAGDFVAELAAFGQQDIDLHVNSPGGDVFEGLAILNSLRAYKGKVTAYVDGIAASAASFILMGADEVVMGRNSELMIHDAWGMCLGNAADMLDMAGRLDKVSDNIADVYYSKAGGSVGQWRQSMRDEAWYTADEAVSAGLADRTAESESAVEASFDLSRFKNKTCAPVPAANEELPDFESLFRQAFEEAA